MARNDTTTLAVESRTTGSSRATRRLRREGLVPGVLYGKGGDPVCFAVGERDLRHALAGSGAVLELTIDGGKGEPAVLKDSQRHPVRGEIMHIDLLRVDLNVAISAVVPVELTGGDDAPGAKEGGVLEHVTRELNIEALPGDIPEVITLDVSHMDINDTLTLESVTPPQGVTLLDDLETTIATLTPPRLQDEEEDEIESETGVVGEGAGDAEGSAADADAGDVPADAGDSSSE
jgi:large subunit ribosomal protein L25